MCWAVQYGVSHGTSMVASTCMWFPIINQPNMYEDCCADSFDSILCGGKPGDLFASLPLEIETRRQIDMQTIRSDDIGPTPDDTRVLAMGHQYESSRVVEWQYGRPAACTCAAIFHCHPDDMMTSHKRNSRSRVSIRTERKADSFPRRKETDGDRRNPASRFCLREPCNTYRTKLTAQPCLVPAVPNTT